MAHAESSQPERKRPRLLSEEDEADEKPFVNHPSLYFDDGNVILAAGRTLFCVHRSLLSKHSPVFQDLFDGARDRHRGLLHVPMEETADEVEALLNVVYDGLRVDVQELTVETFPTLANVLRMAKKYKIDRPCADIVARIRAEWPSTLAQHDAKEAENRARLMKLYSSGMQPPQDPAAYGPDDDVPPQYPEEDIIVHPASVIGLLRECGYTERTLLFPLFYALSRTTWQFGGPAPGHHLAPLPPADVERLVVGVERLRAAHFAFALGVPDCGAAPTNPPHFCRPGAAALWAANVQAPAQRAGLGLGMGMGMGHGAALAREPLEEWRDVLAVVRQHHAQYQICMMCARAMMVRIEGFRQNVWASLSDCFELQ